jgi:glycosyltransferase involved in cell wall biosynthesis
MKVALVHNEYGKPSGEEAVVKGVEWILTQGGLSVCRFRRSSAEIPEKRFGELQAFLAGIYNPFARRAFAHFLDEHHPDVVHVHNLFPFISPSILPECTRRGVPVVMTLHNYRLICPNALLLREGRPCHECLGGHEWRCIRYNCERSLPKSIGYTLRTALARRSGLFLSHVSRFICLTNFQREIHIREGVPADRMVVIPNPAPELPHAPSSPLPAPSPALSPHVGYVGRVSPEKDVPTLLEAARRLPNIPFKVAGSYWRMKELVSQAPPNVEFLDHLDAEGLCQFYTGTRLLAFATRCYENFPTVLLEAMVRGVPIVCTRIGGLPEIVEHDRNGLLYEPGKADDLAEKIRLLWHDPQLRQRLGEAGRDKARQEYSPAVVSDKLLSVYEHVMRSRHP